MNLAEVLRAIFKGQPTLDEFIAAHEPTDIVTVEYLTRQYERLYGGLLGS